MSHIDDTPLEATSARLYRCHERAVYQAWQTRQERATVWERHRMTAEDTAILARRNPIRPIEERRNLLRTKASAMLRGARTALRYLDHLNT